MQTSTTATSCSGPLKRGQVLQCAEKRNNACTAWVGISIGVCWLHWFHSVKQPLPSSTSASSSSYWKVSTYLCTPYSRHFKTSTKKDKDSNEEISHIVHCSTPSHCYLGDDHHRHPNNNTEDHLIRQLTRSHGTSFFHWTWNLFSMVIVGEFNFDFGFIHHLMPKSKHVGGIVWSPALLLDLFHSCSELGLITFWNFQHFISSILWKFWHFI